MKKRMALLMAAVVLACTITGTHADPYHYVIEFHTEFPVSVDVKP